MLFNGETNVHFKTHNKLMNNLKISTWQDYVARLDFEPLFVTVSGSHIYGFNSPDSDVDLRGCHQLPLESIVGLKAPTETIDRESIEAWRGSRHRQP